MKVGFGTFVADRAAVEADSVRTSSQSQLVAVLDVDSERPAAFDGVDRDWLERILAATFGRRA